ncbi:Glycosyl transferase family 8 protein [Klebsormidium nitens]|uniref:Hexosyltransferase n=1 Tax=Klebsormidium nitens TaxID=105231 RepID=A0A1Y1HJ09_KLENI|nr:Glycosyl transferase family 8 protein [Klebsormidium nitens]|eukprot:GAQ78494.1 Glycosyl transferase family 8 protein [Klebsormidium nitens]
MRKSYSSSHRNQQPAQWLFIVFVIAFCLLTPLAYVAHRSTLSINPHVNGLAGPQFGVGVSGAQIMGGRIEQTSSPQELTTLYKREVEKKARKASRKRQREVRVAEPWEQGEGVTDDGNENTEVQLLGEGVGDVTGIASGDSHLPGDGGAWGHDPATSDGLESGLKGGGRGSGKSGRGLEELEGGQGGNEGVRHSQSKRLQQLVSDGSPDDDPASDAVSDQLATWQEGGGEGSDRLINLMKEQVIMARAYTLLAQQGGDQQLARQLRAKRKELQRMLAEATVDADLHRLATERMRGMGALLARARDAHYESTAMVKHLRAMVQGAEDQVKTLKRQSAFLSQLAAKTVPKGLHCLSQRLTVDHSSAAPHQKLALPDRSRLEDPSLFHYALFSDNVLAAAVVVNSTITNAIEPERHVFHIVTDGLNKAAFQMWFAENPPAPAAIEIESVDEFRWLNASYCPVLKQLESESMKEYYFKADGAAQTTHLKYRNPKYLSMLNHLRFYLPEVYPKLDKILFLDDDIVVQRDLTRLWDEDLRGNVNGAVETCGASFHRFDKYLNFSNPLIRDNFDPRACGWAYGMNVFDLRAWKERDITGIYHRWQTQNEDRTLWKLGTLPPGLMTFYGLTHPLDKSWHVLGLGYNPGVDDKEIARAAVIHWNGNMKPWLEIGISKFKPLWTRYINFSSPYLQRCNIAD